MDGSVSPKLDSKGSPKEMRPEISHASKKKKVKEKIVVTVRMGTNNAGKLLKNEGPPSDSWSWRKYGQKSIKGSPYPRGYYRCSTSKGCSAKKQVERCKTDESLLIITYTSSHNHPGPDISSTTMSNLTKSSKQPQENDDQNHDHLIDHHDNHDLPLSPPKEEEEEEEKDKNEEEEHFNYIQSPIRCSQDIVIGVEEEDPFKGKKEKTTILCDTGVVGGGSGGFLLNEEPILINNNMQSSHTTTTTTTHHQLMCFSSSTPKNISELENDFFDELEELPTSSSLFTSFTRSHLSDEIRIPLVPS